MYISEEKIYKLALKNTFNKSDVTNIISLNDMYMDFISNKTSIKEEEYLFKIIEKTHWKSMDQMKDIIINDVIDLKEEIDYILRFKDSSKSSSNYIIENLLFSNVFSEGQIVGLKRVSKRNSKRKLKDATILITDDFIGSGKTIITALQKIHKRIRLKIVIASYISTKEGMKNIIEYCNNSKSITSIKINKSIKYAKNYKDIFDDEVINFIEEICELCKLKKFKFGFKKSGTLVSLDQRSPNNNISMLWTDRFNEPKNNWTPLINRELTTKEIINVKRKIFDKHRSYIYKKYINKRHPSIDVNDFVLLFFIRINSFTTLEEIQQLCGIDSKTLFTQRIKDLKYKKYISSQEIPLLINKKIISDFEEISKLILKDSINALNSYLKKPNKDFLSRKYVVKYI